MKKFLIKISIFGLPFVILFIITILNYQAGKGDLIRIGYIPDFFPTYRNQFDSILNQEIKFYKYSQNTDKKEYDILTIGDSFSELGAGGYQNILATNFNKSILHIDFNLHNNPFQVLISLINSGFFKEYKIKNIILERAEVHFIRSSFNLNLNSQLNISEYKNKTINKSNAQYHSIVSSRIFKFPYYYFLRKNYPERLISTVYSRKLNSNLFSVPNENLYFYHLDVENIELNNDVNQLEYINSIFNNLSDTLKKIGVNLIVIPVPNKYHFYNDFLSDKNEFGDCYFFENYSKLERSYFYIDIVENYKNSNEYFKDFYYYDDSHWSPKGSEFVAKQMIQFIQ